MTTLEMRRPELLTKELKIQDVPGVGRRLRLSTNFLQNFGFMPETRLKVDLNSSFGVITPAAEGDWKVHSRRYAHRRNNPTESVIEFASQSMMQRLAPQDCDRLHFTMMANRIEVRPVRTKLFHIRKHFRTVDKISAFMALSSGLDAWTFRDAGFELGALLEYRPHEARDTQDLTETGVCTFIRNNDVKLVFNEDIASCDLSRVARLVKKRVGTVGVLSIGLQCDDFTNAKSANLKRQEISEFRPSSRELGYYAAKLIELIEPASVFVENVPGWSGSESQGVFGAILTRIGYHVQSRILNGADFGAFTARRRCYFVASAFPGFQFPEPTGTNTVPLREILKDDIPLMTDATNNGTVQKARGTPYERFCSLDRVTAPTVMKSQARGAKDSLIFDDNGKLLRPTLNSLRTLHSMPSEFSLDAVSNEIATEQIGQGIEFPLHAAVVKALHNHLRINARHGTQTFMAL